ncbi:MAG: type 1 glutamine amidotransferase [Egibacteraceae bacterium]
MDFVILQHDEYLPAGALDQVLAQRRRAVRTVRLWQGEPVPAASSGVRALVVLGGHGMPAPDQRDAELALLAACVADGVPVLGICLGAQRLAEATGGRAQVGAGSVGYVPITRTKEAADDPVFDAYPDGMAALRLDADALMPGPGAVMLALTADGAAAGFRVGETAYGVGFHPELDADAITALIPRLAIEDPDGLAVQARRRDAFHLGMGMSLLGRWVDGVVGRTPDEQPWGRRGPQPVPAPGLSLHPAPAPG